MTLTNEIYQLFEESPLSEFVKIQNLSWAENLLEFQKEGTQYANAALQTGNGKSETLGRWYTGESFQGLEEISFR